MKRRLFIFLLLSSALFVQAQKNGTGAKFPSEKTNVKNEYGYEVTQWTNNSRNWHLYFNIESFVDNDHFIIFSERSGKTNLFRVDITTGEMTQMTDEQELKQDIWHLPKYKTLWFLNNKELKALNTETFQITPVYSFTDLEPESFAITCDKKYCVFAANKNPGFSKNHSTGPYAVFRLDLVTKEVKQISPELGFIVGHVQTNPVNPEIISFCWQHRYVKDSPGIVGFPPYRMWWNNIEGTDGGAIGPQEFGLHRTHEFWFPDGTKMGYSARYKFGPNNGKQYIGITSLDGKDNVMFPANVSSAHNQIFKDNKHWISDLFDGPFLVLFTIDKDTLLESKVLFKHESTMVGQPSHPHPHFSPDGKYILFSTDRTGKPEVYTVKVNLQNSK